MQEVFKELAAQFARKHEKDLWIAATEAGVTCEMPAPPSLKPYVPRAYVSDALHLRVCALCSETVARGFEVDLTSGPEVEDLVEWAYGRTVRDLPSLGLKVWLHLDFDQPAQRARFLRTRRGFCLGEVIASGRQRVSLRAHGFADAVAQRAVVEQVFAARVKIKVGSDV